MNTPLKVVIVGAGATGYFLAAAIRRNLPNVDVTIVYDPKIPTVGVGESIAWNCRSFMINYLGLDNEFKWLRKSQSTYKNAIEFRGFDGTKNSKFFTLPSNANASILLDHKERPTSRSDPTLYDLWMHLHARGLISGDPQEYLSELYWLVLNKKSPINSKAQCVVPGLHRYSYHLNADLAGDIVHTLVGVPNGVKEILQRVNQVVLNSDGNIDYLQLENQEQVKADLFFDASGFSRILVNQLPFKFEHCDEYFNNSAIVGRHFYDSHEEYKSHTLSQAMNWGWHFSVPVAGKSGEGYIFNSRWNTDIDQLAHELHSTTGKSDVKFRHITWTPGYYKTSFVKNCIALGLSQGFSEPYDANGFSMVLRVISRIVDNMKVHGTPEAWKADHNHYTRTLCNDIIFRIQCAFHLAVKNDTPYWQELKLAAEKYHTKEKLLDAIFDPNRRPLPGADSDFAFSQHVFVHQALYNQIELPANRCLLNIDHTTEQNALKFMQRMSAKNKSYVDAASSINEFYSAIYPTLLK